MRRGRVGKKRQKREFTGALLAAAKGGFNFFFNTIERKKTRGSKEGEARREQGQRKG